MTNPASVEDGLNATRDALLRGWFDAEVMAEVGEGSEDLVGAVDDLAERFGYWSRSVMRSLCAEWRYCEKKKQFSKELDLTTAVAAYLAAEAKTHAPIAAAVLLVRYGFDAVCECE